MPTVLLLNPMGTDVTLFMPVLMRGTIAALGTVETIPYVNESGIDNVIDGTALLHDRLTVDRGVGETFIVFGYSEGCQVAGRWLRLHGPDLDIDPADIEFIFIGNAQRKFGGFVYQQSAFDTVADTEGYPDDTPYTVTDLVRQYDPIGDFMTAPEIQSALTAVSPAADATIWTAALDDILAVITTPNYLLAVENALFGLAYHLDYFDVTLADSKNVPKVEGNITYLWSPSTPPLGVKNQTKIETAYSRPVALPLYAAAGPSPVTGWWVEDMSDRFPYTFDFELG